MNEVWNNYYKENNNLNSREIKHNIASINYNTKYIGKIICKDNITISPKSKINIKTEMYIDTKEQNKSFVIKLKEGLSKNKNLKLESTSFNIDDGITIYNFSKLYSNIPRGMTIANLINTDTPTENYNDDDIEEIMDRQGNVIKTSQELNTEKRKKALRLINNYKHLFTSDPLYIGCSKVEPREIKLKTEKAIIQPPYRVSPAQRHKLRILIEEMINADIIEPGKSNYAAPVILILKKKRNAGRL